MEYCSVDDAFPVLTAGGGKVKKTKRHRSGDLKTIEMPPLESIPMKEAPSTFHSTARPIPPPMKSADVAASQPHIIPEPSAVPSPAVVKKPQDNWFGTYDDDEDVGIEENFMAYTGSSPVEGEYSLTPSSVPAALAGSAPAALSDPPTTDFWKPLTSSGARTSFFERLPAQPQQSSRVSADMQGQIAAILKRLDALEVGGGAGQAELVSPDTSNMEILMFTMSGIFVMFLMDVMVRAGRR